MSILVLTLKPSQLISSTQNQVNFDPNADVRSISIPALNVGHLSIPPDTNTKLISIQTLNQVIFDLHTKASRFWSPHWNEVNSDPPHRNHAYFDHPPNNQGSVDASTNSMSFSGRVILRVIHTSNCDAAEIRFMKLRAPTRVILDGSINSKTPKYCLVLVNFCICYMVCAQLRTILVARLCYVPFFVYAVLHGVIYRS